jgi:hypothetical protein
MESNGKKKLLRDGKYRSNGGYGERVEAGDFSAKPRRVPRGVRIVSLDPNNAWRPNRKERVTSTLGNYKVGRNIGVDYADLVAKRGHHS